MEITQNPFAVQVKLPAISLRIFPQRTLREPEVSVEECINR